MRRDLYNLLCRSIRRCALSTPWSPCLIKNWFITNFIIFLFYIPCILADAQLQKEKRQSNFKIKQDIKDQYVGFWLGHPLKQAEAPEIAIDQASYSQRTRARELKDRTGVKETELKYEGVKGKERRRGGEERWADGATFMTFMRWFFYFFIPGRLREWGGERRR